MFIADPLKSAEFFNLALRNLNTGNDRSWLHPEIGCDHILVFPQLKIKTKRQ